ncbi:DUF1707 domain-containing protein [Gordonia sp. LSe1-13]|uniref:DUF1707 domain-containing protein n=1 Tax=Gordonia sesuvii TaxID=3116777 RepID=A0ABU7MIJ7_9ACTN|nr:DUF1707 domain-containing protein [Gordonia sp. LSe1-13]
MVESNPDDAVRVGHPERERAISLLNDAFSSGYLEIVEFEQRSDRILQGRTRGELRATLADLPNASLLFPVEPSGPPAQIDGSAAGPVEWDADWSTVRRKGVWQVPRSVLVTGWMGTVDLDFTDAVFPGPSVDVHLQVSTATVKLRIRADDEVHTSNLKASGWSTIKDKAGPPRRPGGAVVVVSGSVSAMTSVKIKRAGAP